MTVLRYVVTAAGFDGQVEFSARGERAKAVFLRHAVEGAGTRAGSVLWSVLRAAEIDPQSINYLTVREDREEPRMVATIVPVLQGAHIAWTVFYRADKDASCFRSLGNRRRIPDALDLALAELARELALPHKP